MSLQLKGVNKSFQQGETRLPILQNLSLTVTPGKVVAVIGESGSGKSTLLSLIAGFEPLDEGEISWDGESTKTWDDKRWAAFRKSGLGFVFQNYHLIPYLTAEENVALPLRLLGREHAQETAKALLAKLGLQARATHLPGQLSGGERQRTAMARALVHRPSLILADEPTGSLDVKTGAQVLDTMFGVLKDLGQTALIVTHSQEVAARCDSVLSLRQGHLWPV